MKAGSESDLFGRTFHCECGAAIIAEPYARQIEAKTKGLSETMRLCTDCKRKRAARDVATAARSA